MPYCRECGMRLPENEEAKFCPNCGSPIEASPVIARRVEVSRRTKMITLWRIETIAVAVVISLAATFVGVALPIDWSEARAISQELGELEKVPSLFSMAMIYGNNLMHTLAMFTPFAGPFYGAYVLFSTGRVIAAMAAIQGSSPVQLLIYTLIFPHAWIEYASYALALSESFWVTSAILRHRFRAELDNLFKAISACALLLLSAAFIETSLISLLA